MDHLIHDVITETAQRNPAAASLSAHGAQLSYGALAAGVAHAADGMLALGLERLDRVAIWMEKREEAVLAMFGASAAGGVFVPVNPLFKAAQVAHILGDCAARVLVTTPERLALLTPVLAQCASLRCVVVTGEASVHPSVEVIGWRDWLGQGAPVAGHRCIDSDMAALLYTSGSTGKPKGVVLSHRNLVAGARSVASYLGNRPEDRILALLPLSFDYGLSQLTTAFSSGACAVLMNHLLSRDIVETVEEERITGLAAVPPLWIQLAQLAWPAPNTLRYITNSGGAMPRTTVDALRRALPQTKVYLMYGLTEAFRSTYLAPEQLDRRPDSIGKAIPNAEVMVLRPDGTRCDAGEPGELVHRGPLVSLGYWNDPARTAERFKPWIQCEGMPLAENAVWSGDTVRMDEEGFLYFISRGDEMIKTSGYRVSPNEIEEVAYASGLVDEAAAFGLPHPVLGQVIALVATPGAGSGLDTPTLLAACRAALPAYMHPARVEVRPGPLPRNPNGKIDRRLLAEELQHTFAEAGA